MLNKRIVWVEDSKDMRSTLGGMFKKGFTKEGVKYEERPNFDSTMREVATGDLADVYIFDNEVLGGESDIYGAEVAKQVVDSAKKLGKEVIVVTLLCSNPEDVQRVHGDELKKRGVPALQKNSDAPLLGFWIGACIQAGKNISLEDWLRETSTVLINEDYLEQRKMVVQSALAVNIMDGKDLGDFFKPPRDYIDSHMNDLKPYLVYPGSFELMNKIFPPVSRGRIEAK